METKMVWDDKKKCCGCSACAEVCPVNAIEMVVDKEGFSYPQISLEKCIHCGKCEQTCGYHSLEDRQPLMYWEIKTKSEEIRSRSRSGGSFFEIATRIIEEGGIVYGVGFRGANVEYVRADTIEGCRCMQGSKYVECSANGILPRIKEDLDKGYKVLFSGTACQVAGVKSYLAKIKALHQENLLTIDIICHGVPSQLIYQDYIRFLEKKYSGTITVFDFRDKTYGWRNHVESFVINGKKRTKDTYSGMFYSNYFLRPCCGECPFASFSRPADITIGDFLGVSKVKNDFDDNKGVSVVIVNTDKGEKYVDMISESVHAYPVTKELCVQPNMLHPSRIPDDRGNAWNCYWNSSFDTFLRKYGRYDISHKLKWYLKDYRRIKKAKINK